MRLAYACTSKKEMPSPRFFRTGQSDIQRRTLLASIYRYCSEILGRITTELNRDAVLADTY